jgi:hypothetical protein
MGLVLIEANDKTNLAEGNAKTIPGYRGNWLAGLHQSD